MADKLYVDFETFSEVDIRKRGGKRYAEDQSTQVLCLGYAFNNEPAEVWTPDKPFPRRMCDHVAAEKPVYAHNITFDWRIWNEVLVRDFDIDMLALEQCVDTMALCNTYTLPGSLAFAGAALNLTLPKLESGVRLINKCCKPNKKGLQPMPWDDPETFKELFLYCKRDVEAMREIVQKLPRETLLPIEQEIWLLSTRMNDTGLPVDTEAVHAILKYLTKYVKDTMSAVSTITGGACQTINQIAKVQAWCLEQGIDLPNMQAETITEMLAREDLPEGVRDLLKLRQELGRTSTAKFKKVTELEYHDWVYDNLQYHGTSTGRWAGRGFQMHNLPRAKVDDPEKYITAFKEGRHVPDPVTVGKGLIRSIIKAPDGYTIMCSDYSSIENRKLAWLAGDEVTLQGFRDGFDQYADMAAHLYQIPLEEVTKDQRQFGKIIILGCLASGTLLLTDKGPVKIEDITLNHRLWDGDAWVTHQGVLNKGRKPCIKFAGLRLTPDHKIFTEDNKKEEAKRLHRQNGLYEKKAICLVFGKLLSTFQEAKLLTQINKVMDVDTTLNVDSAALLSLSWWRTLSVVIQLNAESAANKQTLNLTWKHIVKLQAATKKLLIDLSTDGTQLKLDAVSQQLLNTSITEAEELVCAMNGSKNLETLLYMLCPSLGMTTQLSNWTELITKETTSQETFGSAQDLKTCLTHDILESGSNNRFTVLTSEGPLIVSNCGYMMGVDRFQEVAKDWGIILSLPEAKHAIDTYREKYYLIKRLWHRLNQAAREAVLTGKKQTYLKITFGTATVKGIRWLAMRLPSGKSVYYMDPAVENKHIPGYEHMGKVPTITHSGVNPYSKKWSRLSLSPGRITENATQATAREAMAYGMLNVQKELLECQLIGTVHDEALGLVPEELAIPAYMDDFNTCLCDVPWAPDCPLKAEGYFSKRYKKG